MIDTPTATCADDGAGSASAMSPHNASVNNNERVEEKLRIFDHLVEFVCFIPAIMRRVANESGLRELAA